MALICIMLVSIADASIWSKDEFKVTADFTLTPTIGKAPLKVTIKNISTYQYEGTYTWYYGDGTSYDNGGQNPPAHTYKNPGVYKVTIKRVVRILDPWLGSWPLTMYNYHSVTVNK